MKVAVITPYYKESLDILRRCHDSVAAQTHPCTHIMIADGHASPEVASWDVDHIVLPFSHGDNGNTPRSIGAMSALNRGFDAVAYLDGDNWFHPEHVESLLTVIREENVPMAFSNRFIVSLDGTIMRNLPEDDEPTFVDTSSILHTSAVARLIPMWAMMDPALGPICDQIFLVISNYLGIAHARSGRRTMYYETNYKAHYDWNNMALPDHPREVNLDAVFGAYSKQRCAERLGFVLNFPKADKAVPPSESAG
jgi:glycosyltransferase involved in cell wall biosynthesis